MSNEKIEKAAKFFSKWFKITEDEAINCNDETLDCMQSYADQQTALLQSRIKELEDTLKGGEHYFNAPQDDKSSRFCICGKYLTDNIHKKNHHTMKEKTALQKRHKWDMQYWAKEGHATCKVCGTVKERHYPTIFYFVPYDKITVGNKAPNCNKVLHRHL